ncbi:MAG TPA: hypothetical protein VGN20_12105 [Mucilaginibacter sp.]|jgi:hypothetical protein
MNRTIKILLAFGCVIFGCVITTAAQDMISSDSEWLSPIASCVGFVLIMGAGLYSFLKIIRPLIF